MTDWSILWHYYAHALNIGYTSAYIRCAHSGTTTLSLGLACYAARCSTIIIIKKKKKKIPLTGIEHARSSLQIQSPSPYPLGHQGCSYLIPKASYVYLAENALNALLSSAWDNWVSQSVSQWVSDSRALVIRYGGGAAQGAKFESPRCQHIVQSLFVRMDKKQRS